MIHILITLLALGTVSCSLHAEVKFRMESLTTEQGLSQSIVYSAFQDRKGFLWFGTRDGLNRYDGYRFTVFRHKPSDTTSLPWIAVRSIGEDGDGNIWVVSRGWVSRLDRRTFTFTRYAHSSSNPRSLSSNFATCLLGDRFGDIWVGTDRGLNRFDRRTGTFTRFLSNRCDPSALANDRITSLYEDRAGRLWVGTAGGFLHRLNRERGNFTVIDPGFRIRTDLLCLGEDRAGNIYIGYRSGEGSNDVVGVDPVTGSIVVRVALPVLRVHPGDGMVHPLGIDSLGGLWAQITSPDYARYPARQGGLYRIPLTGDVVATPFREARLVDTYVSTMLCDRSGIVWFGTGDGIVKMIPDKPRFAIYRNIAGDPESLSNDHIRAIHKDREGVLWVGTDNGLNRLDERSGRWIRYLHDPSNRRSISNSTINVIFEDVDGTLLLGTNGGINAYDRATNTFSIACRATGDRRSRLPSHIWSFCRDSSGRLWVGTLSGGIFLFDRKNRFVRKLNLSTEDPAITNADVVWDIHLDRHGTLWAGTGVGLYRWHPERNEFERYKNSRGIGLGEMNVCAIMEDGAGTLWFTTYGAGLHRYNRSSGDFTNFTTHNGLPSNALYGTLMDGNGKLWISSNMGLAAYDPATGKCRVYNAGDGLQSNEFSFKAFHRTGDGELLFGGIRGLNRFHPDSLSDSQHPVPIAVSEFRVFDRIVRQELQESDTVEIDYNQNFISFEFAALDYMNPAGIRYAYMLAGFDDDWIYSADRRYASFTNLDPGTYMFMVKGTNSDGIWNSDPFRITLRVIPPFWMTLWFKGSAILAMIIIVATGTLLWVRSLRGKDILRRRSVELQLQALRLQVNPHFIFNSLSSIQHLILKKEWERGVEYLSRFARLVQAVLENSERTSIPLAEELGNLRHYLHLEGLRFEGRFRYSIDIDPELDIERVVIPTMLIQPYVENAIRHGLRYKTGGGNLLIRIAHRGDHIRCLIEDDGIGRRRAEEFRKSRGYGRRSMGMKVTEDRLNILNATAPKGEAISMRITDLHDEHGSPCGTRVEIFIPVQFL